VGDVDPDARRQGEEHEREELDRRKGGYGEGARVEIWIAMNGSASCETCVPNWLVVSADHGFTKSRCRRSGPVGRSRFRVLRMQPFTVIASRGHSIEAGRRLNGDRLTALADRARARLRPSRGSRRPASSHGKSFRLFARRFSSPSICGRLPPLETMAR
jgi:hypothetical protein